MCGIAGLYQLKTRSKDNLSAIAKSMADAMQHRGPDDSGLWVDSKTGIALSHRRLSIIDLSPEGRQPMVSASGRYVISFNGEIYNFLELYRELVDLGHIFRGRSDTEVILAAAEQWGLNHALQKFNGMFAMAVWDGRDRVLHLIRDRLGKKPLYVGWAGSCLVFASELKAFMRHPAFEAEVNRSSLQLFMRYASIPAPHCIYEKCWTVPAGCRMAVRAEALNAGEDLSLRMESYWHHARKIEEARVNPPDITDAQAIEELEELLSRCVRDRMVSDVPIGAFLSGGIDSSLVVALMQREARQPIKTYTVGFREAGFDEASHAREIASHLGTDHHELYLTASEAMEVVRELPDIYDEPFADISAIPTLLVARYARKEVTVALSGDGGDELFGGYNRHFTAPAIWAKTRIIPLSLRVWLAGRIKALPPSRWDSIAKGHPQAGDRLHKIADILPLGSTEEIYRRLLSHWANPQEVVIGGSEPGIQLFEYDRQTRVALTFAEKMMAGDALSYLPNDILVKVDRASMAASLEARAPLLDQRMYEYTWTLPESMKIRDGKGKWLLRQVLGRHLPGDMFERPKQGFAMPVGEWLRGGLREWAEDLLSAERLEGGGYLNPAPVREMWNAHQQGSGNNATRLWSVLCFQAWQAKWLRAAGS